MSRRRRTGALLAVASSALLLAGCGGSDDAAGAPASPPAASSSASAASSAAPAADYDTIAVPDEFGGGTIPVPPGATPGEPTVSDGNWTVVMDGIDKDQGIDFYREALPALGYTVDVDIDALVVAADDARSVSATLAAGPDGVSVKVEPVP